MEYIHQGIALGVDLVILGFCCREYATYKRNIKNLKAAPQLNIDGNLKSYVSRQKDQKVPYAVLRGVVVPIGAPLRSVMSPSVTGVVQVIKLSEHRVARGFFTFWTEQRKLLHVSTNEMPFQLQNNGQSVTVVDALSDSVLDLDVVYDTYEPASLSIFDHIFGFFSGVRQKGFQTTESMLRDGSFITAIGELELEGDTLRLQPSGVSPLFLTTATKSAVIKKLEEAKSVVTVKILVFGAISAILVGIVGRRIYLKIKKDREDRAIKQSLEKERKARRARNRPKNLSPDKLCVVCCSNPKEIIVLPCGHVCLCEDCSERIKEECPICRTKIRSRAAVFIS